MLGLGGVTQKGLRCGTTKILCVMTFDLAVLLSTPWRDTKAEVANGIPYVSSLMSHLSLPDFPHALFPIGPHVLDAIPLWQY